MRKDRDSIAGKINALIFAAIASFFICIAIFSKSCEEDKKEIIENNTPSFGTLKS